MLIPTSFLSTCSLLNSPTISWRVIDSGSPLALISILTASASIRTTSDAFMDLGFKDVNAFSAFCCRPTAISA